MADLSAVSPRSPKSDLLELWSCITAHSQIPALHGHQKACVYMSKESADVALFAGSTNDNDGRYLYMQPELLARKTEQSIPGYTACRALPDAKFVDTVVAEKWVLSLQFIWEATDAVRWLTLSRNKTLSTPAAPPSLSPALPQAAALLAKVFTSALEPKKVVAAMTTTQAATASIVGAANATAISDAVTAANAKVLDQSSHHGTANDVKSRDTGVNEK